MKSPRLSDLTSPREPIPVIYEEKRKPVSLWTLAAIALALLVLYTCGVLYDSGHADPPLSVDSEVGR